jgi:superfamily II RNA helicase
MSASATSPYLRICSGAAAPALPADPAITYPYSLDPFQLWAIDAISRHENVLVTAKTGSGKTLVGEYQIAESLRRGKRVFYTTPIKSLSNQKFADLTKQFPRHRVGIMTGDIKFMPDADVVIMTTEILQNLLFKQGTLTEHIGLTASLSLDRLDAVIFDECHYINNKERGKVWEQTLILLPRSVSLILLSATIDRPDLFASWLGNLRQQPISLIATKHRVVPLTHYAARVDGTELSLTEIMATGAGGSEIYDGNAYRRWLDCKAADRKKERDFEAAAKGRKGDVTAAKAAAAAGNQSTVLALPATAGKFHTTSFIHQLNVCIDSLRTKDLLPALFFSFSRADCERYAAAVQGALIDSSDSAAVANIIDYHLRTLKAQLEGTAQYWTLRELLLRGVAFHHSGLLPVLKEMVEILFGKGYVRTLFCTETFAVGINMPTRTVVFTDLKKHDESGLRAVYTDEYIQMAGRAGRRGKDVRGTVIYLPSRQPLEAGEMQRLMCGAMPAVQSRMEFGYEFILKTFHSGDGKWREIIDQSYWYQQQLSTIRQLEGELEAAKRAHDAAAAAAGIQGAVYDECSEWERLEQRVKVTYNADRKAAQKALDQWKNRHMGPVWATAMKAWPQMRAAQQNVERLAGIVAEERQAIADPRTLLAPKLRFLEAAGYLAAADADADGPAAVPTLTEKGHAATEVNEGHAILMTEAYSKGLFEQLTAQECIAFLGAFLTDRETEDVQRPIESTAAIAAAYEQLEGLRDDLSAAAGEQGSPYWAISTEAIDIIYFWLDGMPAKELCEAVGMYEGNLTKVILKAANLLEELVALATLAKNTDLLNKVHGLQGKLVCGIAAPDSLYLRLA